MKILVIVPAYNEEKNILKVIENCEKENLDYIIVNDCSKDNTEEVLRKNKKKFISLPNNLGIGGAIQTGYKYAKENNYDYAVQIDGDGQHHPKYIHVAIEKMKKEDVDQIIGSRFLEKKGFQSSLSRRMGITIISLVIKFFTGIKITDPTSGYRIVNKKAIDIFCKTYPRDYPEPEVISMLIRNKLKILEIPVEMHAREEGESSIFGFKIIYYMIKVNLAIIFERIKAVKN